VQRRLLTFGFGALNSVLACSTESRLPSQPRLATVIWHAPIRALGPPAFDDRSVYFSTRDHTIVAIDRASGQIRWTAVTDGRGSYVGTADSPVCAADVVVFGDEFLYAFDAASGTRRWVFGQGSMSHNEVGAFQFRTDGRRIYAGSAIGAAFGINASTGELVWRQDLLQGVAGQVRVVAVRDSAVYIVVRYGSVAREVALNSETGVVLWSFESGPSMLQRDIVLTPVGAALQLLLVARDDGSIVALDALTGGPRWTIASPIPPGAPTSIDDRRMAAWVDGLIATTTMGGAATSPAGRSNEIIGYDLITGTERWRVASTQGSASLNFNQVITNADQGYINFTNGVLGIYDLETGGARGLLRAPTGLFTSAPVISHDTMFLGGWDAAYAIRR
jgi:outer membrane protein assembly factor BamB